METTDDLAWPDDRVVRSFAHRLQDGTHNADGYAPGHPLHCAAWCALAEEAPFEAAVLYLLENRRVPPEQAITMAAAHLGCEERAARYRVLAARNVAYGFVRGYMSVLNRTGIPGAWQPRSPSEAAFAPPRRQRLQRP